MIYLEKERLDRMLAMREQLAQERQDAETELYHINKESVALEEKILDVQIYLEGVCTSDFELEIQRGYNENT